MLPRTRIMRAAPTSSARRFGRLAGKTHQAVAPGWFAATAGPGGGRVKITAVETFRVPPRWLFCKITTDEGLVGWGEPVVEGRAATVEAAVEELSDYLVGSDALRIEDTWQVLTRGGFYRGGAVLASAVAGIDQALWDIASKAYGVPVYALLGGPVREKGRIRSEERRVGKEGRSRWSPYH